MMYDQSKNKITSYNEVIKIGSHYVDPNDV